MVAKKQTLNADVQRFSGTWLQNFLLSVATTGTISCFGFLWNANKTLTKLEQLEIQKAQAIDELRIKLNNIQLDVRDVREKVIRLEILNQQK